MRFRHRYEVDPRYIEQLEKAGLVFSGKAPNQPIMQILEIPSHPFFMGTQAHPCLTSRPLRPQPMFVGLVAAAMQKRYPQRKIARLYNRPYKKYVLEMVNPYVAEVQALYAFLILF